MHPMRPRRMNLYGCSSQLPDRIPTAKKNVETFLSESMEKDPGNWLTESLHQTWIPWRKFQDVFFQYNTLNPWNPSMESLHGYPGLL